MQSKARTVAEHIDFNVVESTGPVCQGWAGTTQARIGSEIASEFTGTRRYAALMADL
jgi:hypothetical protein